MGAARSAPPGFIRFSAPGADVVCAAHLETVLRDIVRRGTLYDFAASQTGARPLAGRGVAYAVTLPGDVERVVVRHNRHGGLLAPLTGDLFAPPTRAPYELEMAERLRGRGVPTPFVLAYALYPGGPFRRADVMTREVPHSTDLSTALVSADAAYRATALAAAARLVRALSAAGARHHDLNIKNILLHDSSNSAPEALVLDVDRVTFGGSGDVLEQNLARLLRSAQKWQRERGAQVTDAELEAFAALVRDRAPLAVITSS